MSITTGNVTNIKTLKLNKFKQIEEDVIHLKQSMDLLNTIVCEQQPYIDSIEDFIILSKENTKSALVELKQAEEYSNSTSYISYYIGAISSFFAVGLILLVKK